MPKEKEQKAERYIEAVGRRKTAAARVRLVKGGSGITVYDQTYQDYFKTDEQRRIAAEALALLALTKEYGVSAHIAGGGLSAQAEALRHGIARALSAADAEWRAPLKKAGFLKRDPRAKERRKFGRKGKARKGPQWSKR